MNRYAFLSHRIQESDLEEDAKHKALRNLLHANLDEFDILYGILEIKATWRFAGEILRGGHVRIFDMGDRYDAWKKLPSADTRRSSHRSDGPQYHVNGPLVQTVLFGVSGNWTWVQLEGNPQGLGHIIDWIKYSVTHENQGLYGSSSHVENRPIAIPSAPPYVVEPRPAWVDKLSREPRGGSPFR